MRIRLAQEQEVGSLTRWRSRCTTLPESASHVTELTHVCPTSAKCGVVGGSNARF